MFIELCFIRYYRVLTESISNVFHFITTFFKNQSVMCETKAVVVSISNFLLIAASICIYQAHTENKVGHHSKLKNQGPCENE